MGNRLCCGGKKTSRSAHSRPALEPKNVTMPTASTPRSTVARWDTEEIVRTVDACEQELKELIARTEVSPLPLCSQKPGIHIYGIDTPRGFLMKSVWDCPCPPHTVLAFTRDDATRLTWDPTLAECRQVMDITDEIGVTYERYNKIVIVSARDILSAGKLCSVDDGLLDVSVSIQMTDFPPVPGVVRAHLYVGGYHIRPTPQGSLVSLYNEMDFGGAIPRKLLVKMSAMTLTGWVTSFNQAIVKYAAEKSPK